MLLRQRIPPLAWALLALSLTSVLQADTLVLVTGEKFEGRLLSRAEKKVIFEIQVSEAIAETRAFDAANVARIDVTPEWESAFQGLADTIPGSLSRPEADYARIVEQRLMPYLKAYPQSPRKAEIETRITTLREESTRVGAGERKLDGQWITAAEVAPRRGEIEAEILHRLMAEAVKERNWPAALDLLVRIERDYPGAQAVPCLLYTSPSPRD